MEFWHTLLQLVGVAVVVVILSIAFVYAVMFGSIGAMLLGLFRAMRSEDKGTHQIRVERQRVAESRRLVREEQKLIAEEDRARKRRRKFRPDV